MFRWPGKIKPGEVSNEIVAHLDMLPTLLAVAGDTEVKDKLLKGYTIGDMTGASGVLPMPMSAMGQWLTLQRPIELVRLVPIADMSRSHAEW